MSSARSDKSTGRRRLLALARAYRQLVVPKLRAALKFHQSRQAASSEPRPPRQ